MDHDAPTIAAIGLDVLGERLSPLRLRAPEALREMERSLSRHGQLVAVVRHRQDDKVELVDGYKRLIGARALGWPALRAEVHAVTGPAAKLLLWQSNARQALSDREEAWLVRALYRDDRLTQPQIGQLLGAPQELGVPAAGAGGGAGRQRGRGRPARAGLDGGAGGRPVAARQPGAGRAGDRAARADHPADHPAGRSAAGGG